MRQAGKDKLSKEKKKNEQLEQALEPKRTFEYVVEKAKLILPQMVNDKAWSDQRRISIPEMRSFSRLTKTLQFE